MGIFLVKVFTESHELGFLPDSQRKLVMALSFKKDDEDVANYRPFSLINVDYRIVSFTLARHMQNIMKLCVM